VLIIISLSGWNGVHIVHAQDIPWNSHCLAPAILVVSKNFISNQQ
jgi:hypothetical protein